jgi:PKD repeat protein
VFNNTSAAQNPTHVYTNVATLFPTLTCINAYGEAIVASGPAIVVTAPLPIPFTATPSNGVPAPMTVHFTSPSVDAETNSISTWRWDFGDGFTNITQNPSHTYSNSGSFFPSLTCVNYLGDIISGVGPTIVVPTSSLLNGGFETDSFTNWSLSGYSNLTRVTTAASYAHSGKYGVQMGATASEGFGYLSQSFATSPGAAYLVSFWLNTPINSTPDDFRVLWNGTIALEETNIAKTGWTNLQLTVTANSASSVLQFGFVTAAGLYFGLDDVVVTPITPSSPFDIATVTLSATDLVLSGTGGQSGRSCRLVTSSNLALPLAQWTPVATNLLGADGAFIITATNALDPQAPRRFYSLQLR